MYKTDPVLFYGIVCLGIFLIISLNVSLFSWVRNNTLRKEIKMTKSMLKTVQNPWHEEDQDLDQLHTMVSTLNEKSDQKDD
jgi:hypothetical protein